MASYLFVDTTPLVGLAKAGLLETLLTPNSGGGRQLIVTQEVLLELRNLGGPSSTVAEQWVISQRNLGNLKLLDETIVDNPTGNDGGERSIAAYLAGDPRGVIRNGFSIEPGSNSLVVSENPNDINVMIKPYLNSQSPNPETTTGFLSNRVLDGSLSYNDAVTGWNETVNARVIMLNDPQSTDPSGVNIFGPSAVGNSGTRSLGAADVPLVSNGVQVGTLHFGGLKSDGSVANVEYQNSNLLGGDLGLTEYPQWNAQSKIQIQRDGTVTVFPGSTANTANGPDVPESFTAFTTDGRIYKKAFGQDVIKLNELEDDNAHGLVQKASLNVDDDSTVVARDFVDGTSTKTVFDTGTQPWSSETSAFDAYQRLQSQRVVFDDGNQQVKQYDPNNTHPYTELDIDEDATGKPTAVQTKIDGAAASVGQVLGSTLGRALAPNNQFGSIAIGTVAGAIGQKLAQAFATSLQTNAATFDLTSAFTDFHISIAGAGAGSVASFLVAELGHALA